MSVVPLVAFSTMKAHLLRVFKRRGLTKKHTRNFLSCRTHEFKQALDDKARITGTACVLTEETCTSRWCSRCGKKATTMANRIFTCTGPECNYSMPRDVHGAVSILDIATTVTSTQVCFAAPAPALVGR